MVKAIAVDMDGTFLDSNKHYDKERFEKIFKALKERNIEFIAASGNQFAKLKSIFGERDMFFISENGAVIYKGNTLYNHRSFNTSNYKAVVDYLNIERNISEFIVCGLKSAYILKDTSEAFKKDAHFYYHQLEEIDCSKRFSHVPSTVHNCVIVVLVTNTKKMIHNLSISSSPFELFYLYW